jgi:hypothetical protein
MRSPELLLSGLKVPPLVGHKFTGAGGTCQLDCSVIIGLGLLVDAKGRAGRPHRKETTLEMAPGWMPRFPVARLSPLSQGRVASLRSWP